MYDVCIHFPVYLNKMMNISHQDRITMYVSYILETKRGIGSFIFGLHRHSEREWVAGSLKYIWIT